jgi:hypothetical protein
VRGASDKLFSSHMTGQIVNGNSPSSLIESYTESSSRIRPLPEWVLDGAVVGMQGGPERVFEIKDMLDALDTPIAAFQQTRAGRPSPQKLPAGQLPQSPVPWPPSSVPFPFEDHDVMIPYSMFHRN